MEKIDFKKELKHLYKVSAKEVSVVEVPPMNFIVTEGRGDPNTSSEYMEAIEALYPVAYALKFKAKKSKIDFVVMSLEGFGGPMIQLNSVCIKEIWNWTAMIMQPDYVTKEMYEEAAAEVGKRKGLKALGKMRFETYQEGLPVQILHIGPYAEEGPTIAKLHDYIKDHGYQFNGKHHEIYLSDPRKTVPEKLKTIPRQPTRN